MGVVDYLKHPLPFQLLETAEGSVLVYLGYKNWVADPLSGEYYELDGAGKEAAQLAKLTFSQRLNELGANIGENEIYAELDTPAGKLIVEQTADVALAIGSIDLEKQKSGTFMGRGEEEPPVYIYKDGRAELLDTAPPDTE